MAREPLYNTRAVVLTTGVPADTIRAWERRYGLPRPFRTSTNQRLYTEQDIGVISWLRGRTDEGMTISQAIQRLKLEHPAVTVIDSRVAPTPPSQAQEREPQAARLRQRLLDAVIVFDTRSAERVIDEALARFTVEEFCVNIVEPVLHEIGVRGSRNELQVAAEHFATRLLTGRLASIFAMVSPLDGRGTIVAACPEGEQHEVGLLVLAIALSHRGWRVVYLGAGVPTNDLIAAIGTIRPDLICLSATTERAVRQALAASLALHTEMAVPPPVAIGGRAVAAAGARREDSGAHIVAGNATEVVDQLAVLIDRH